MAFSSLNFSSPNYNNNGAKETNNAISNKLTSQSQYNEPNVVYAKTKHLRHHSTPTSSSSSSLNSSSSDFLNILFLFFLYFLQGIPLGLAASLPLILSSRNVSYSAQAWFRYVRNYIEYASKFR